MVASNSSTVAAGVASNSSTVAAGVASDSSTDSKGSQPKSILVVGYGNTLRGDDGAGPMVVEQIAAKDLAGVRTLNVQQLTPEIADEIAQSDVTIFVDAFASTGRTALDMKRLAPRAGRPALGHALEPEVLLNLAFILFGSSAEGWMVAIPASDFEYAETLSPIASRGVAEAVIRIEELVRERIKGTKLNGPCPVLAGSPPNLPAGEESSPSLREGLGWEPA